MDNYGDKKIGAVLVQGGGIAGIQASLDLANSGFKVYLIERLPAIGGMMSHLDKTFPTGDCAICIVSPKLVECARNLNIEILTLSEVVNLEGKPGQFTATIKRYPRYVDEDRCTDCRECTDACPVNVFNHFDRGLGTRKAIAKYNDQAVPNVFNILKQGHAPCKISCPANINVQGYIQLIKKKEYVEAVNLIRERNPLSAICGRVCTHPCETACIRKDVDSPVAIRQLKRFASDKEMELIESGEIALPEEKTPPPDAQKVAIIGAGPSGLTVAHDLAERDFAITVYEELPAAGGMLRWGIPEYRLPLKVLDHEIELIRRKGVTFVFNCRVGKDVSIEKIRDDYDAVFIGVGAQKSGALGIDGENLDGIIHGIEFLRRARTDDDKPAVKGRVVVIGGGDVAVDAACTAVRFRPESVTILYRRSAGEMPAIEKEINHAKEEGVNFEFLTAPVEFLSDKRGMVRAVRCIKMELGEPDESGRPIPIPIPGSGYEVEAETVIIAIGNFPDPLISGIVPDLSLSSNSTILTDDYGITEKEGIFAGGDIVTGAATVIEAVAAGKRAADSIERYLNGEDFLLSRFEDTIQPIPVKLLPSTKDVGKKPSAVAEELPVEQRIKNFEEVEKGFSEESALAECERCLNCGLCSECGACLAVCEQNAIDLTMKEETINLDVGSVILAPGFEEFRAELKGEYGYGRYPDVLTSVQFERMLSASGPFEGHVVRRSDGREARRIAFIQCVGSRDISCGKDYCSSVCCMVTTKQALVAREHQPDIKATIFYMDIRAYGKDFEQYYERAKNQAGIQYIKSIPSRILQVPGSNELRMRFVNENAELEEQGFDLVVLSVGMEPGTSVNERARYLNIELNEFGFCSTDRFAPLTTSRPGVFVAGTFQEPKDIPETVTQASAAASLSMELLTSARNSLITKDSYPDKHDVTDEVPRIGVFVCHCGMNIGSVVDIDRVVEIASQQPGVVMAAHSMYSCSDTSLSELRDAISEYRLNRVVVASCTPRTHEPLFRETLREAGLNPHLFELANIRDQCSWVHSSEPEEATEKAIDLVCMSIARAGLLAPLQGGSSAVNQNAFVIGGGMSGMTAALALGDQGFNVHLVERSSFLGGNLNNLYYILEHEDISGFTAGLIQRVENHPNVKLYLETEVTAVSGHVGNFRMTLSRNGKKFGASSGAVIVATGAGQAGTTEFLNGESNNVITQVELEKRLHEHTFPLDGQNVVIIQCVGSRNNERPYCSRICCSMAIKNALKIKEMDPDANVFVLYRDIRTYGFREHYYKKAREKGVVFIRYSNDAPPEVAEDNSLVVTINSPDFPDVIEIEAGHIVLSTGVEASENNKHLSEMLKVPLNTDGFFVEAHMKLRPVDFATEGIFLCGLAHSPKFIDENISQARAAAARAATVLSKTHLDVGAEVSHVDQSTCISCMTCVNVCPYTAPFVNADHKAQIEAAKCMGCGICTSECPARAIRLRHSETDQFEIMIDELFADRILQDQE